MNSNLYIPLLSFPAPNRWLAVAGEVDVDVVVCECFEVGEGGDEEYLLKALLEVVEQGEE